MSRPGKWLTIAAVSAVGLLVATSGCRREQAPAREFVIATGWAQEPEPAAAAEKAARMAMERLGGKPLRGVVFYENFPGHPQEREVGAAVRNVAGDVPAIGVRAIPYCDQGALWENSVVVLAIGGRDAAVEAVAEKLEDDRLELGRRLGRRLARGSDLRLVMVLSEPNLSFAPEHISVENFLLGLEETLGEQVMVFGGNGMPLQGEAGSVQFLQGEAMEGAVVALGIGGPVRFIGSNANEFEPVDRPITVTKARGKWVMEFDGRPAAEVYRELSGKKPGEPITYDDTDPIGVDLGDGQLYVRMVLFEKKAKYTPEEARRKDYIDESKDLPAGSLRFVAEVPEGTRARVLVYKKDPQRILRSAAAGVERAIGLMKPGETPLLVLTSSCCARRYRLRELDPRADEVKQGIRLASGAATVPVFGLDAWGELGPINTPYKGLPYQYQQHTFVSGLLVLTR